MKDIKGLGIPSDQLQEVIGFAHALEHARSNLENLATQRREIDRWATDFSRRVDLALSGPESETFLGNILYHFLSQTGDCILLRNTEKQIASGVNSLIEKLRGNKKDVHFALDMIKRWLDDQLDEEQVYEKTCSLLRILLRKLTNKEVPADLSVPAEMRAVFSFATEALGESELEAGTKADLNRVIHFINLQNQLRPRRDLTMNGIDFEVGLNVQAAGLSGQARDIFITFHSMAQLEMAYKIFFAIAAHLGVQYDYPSDES